MRNSKDIKDTNYENNYSKWKEFHKIDNDESGFKMVSKVRNAYEASRNYLLSSCFWDSYTEASTGVMTSGGSWFKRRELQEKMALMWYLPSSSDNFESNIKSPMARGRINTFVNQMKKLNLEIGALPNNKEDRNSALVADKVLNYWFRNSDSALSLSDAWEDMAIHGNSFIKVSYVIENKNYRFPKTKDLTEEERKQITNKVKKVIYDAPVTTQIIDDVVIEHVPISEIYPDPAARNIHGMTYRAGYMIRKRYVTLDYFHSVYDNHPNAKNQDKVKGASAYRDMTEYFFEPPKNTMTDNIVELLEMEDLDNDCFYVVANDIPILGMDNGEPLPWNHKESSYFKMDFIRVPGQFFGIGICDLLENTQASYEVALNMIAEYIYRTYNYKLLIGSSNYGEITNALTTSTDTFIPIDNSDNQSLASKVFPLQVSAINFDIFRFLDLMEKHATMATNIDPVQMALMGASRTATSDMLNKELMMAVIGGVVFNNINGDLKHAFRAVWKLMQQFYTKMRAKNITGKSDEKPKKRQIRLDNIELKLNDKTSRLEEIALENDYSFFEITDKYLNTKDELNIYIKPDSVDIQTKGSERQKLMENFAQLIPFAVDPNNPQQVMNHQMPMINAIELFKDYVYTNRLPNRYLLNKSSTNKIEVQLAEQHVMAILNGETVQGTPGQSSAHLEYEYSVLDALSAKRNELLDNLKSDLIQKTEQIKRDIESSPKFDPFTGSPLPLPQPQPDARILDDLQKVEDAMIRLQEHLVIESMPAAMRNTRVNMMKEQEQPQQPPMAQAPMPPYSNAPQITPEMMNAEQPGTNMPMPSPEGGAVLPNAPMMQ